MPSADSNRRPPKEDAGAHGRRLVAAGVGDAHAQREAHERGHDGLRARLGGEVAEVRGLGDDGSATGGEEPSTTTFRESDQSGPNRRL